MLIFSKYILKTNMINKDILYDVNWQRLRVSLLGKFVTPEGMKDNLNRLDQYIKEASDPQETFHRLWRAVNLLNAVRMGFSGMDLYGSKQDKFLLIQRAVWAQQYKAMQKRGFTHKALNWVDVKDNLKELHRVDPDQFNLIRKNLVQRTKQGIKKAGSLDYRSELVKFLSIMNEINPQ